MTILVTGGTGFIGGHLTRRLLDQGLDVRLLVRNPEKAKALREAGAEIIEGDLLDPAAVARAVVGCHTVYHVAGQMPKPGKPRSLFIRTNTETTRNLVDAAIVAKVARFVYASTSGVYGLLRNPVDETSRLSPASPYRESKALAEKICLNAHAKSGLPVVIARLSSSIGPGSTSFLGLARSLSKGDFRTIGDGRNFDHITPVADIVRGLQLCGETKGIEGNIYLIAGDTAMPIGDILRDFADAMGAPAPVGALPDWPYRLYTKLSETLYKAVRMELPYVYRYGFFLADRTLINDKAKRDLGFYPALPLKDAIRDAVAEYRQNGLL